MEDLGADISEEATQQQAPEEEEEGSEEIDLEGEILSPLRPLTRGLTKQIPTLKPSDGYEGDGVHLSDIKISRCQNT